jgi:hypothetical protein
MLADPRTVAWRECVTITLLLAVLICSTLSGQAPAVVGVADHELEVAANALLALCIESSFPAVCPRQTVVVHEGRNEYALVPVPVRGGMPSRSHVSPEMS